MTEHGTSLTESREAFIDRLSEVGTPPEGVDFATYVIASVPPEELTPLLRENSIGYEGLSYLRRIDPAIYRHVTEDPQPVIEQAREIKNKQFDLSKVKRRIVTATVSGSLAVTGFLGGYALTNEAKQQMDADFAKQHPAQVIDRSKDHGALIAGGVLGVLAGTLGFGAASFAGVSDRGMARLAYRPAQKAVRKATQK